MGEVQTATNQVRSPSLSVATVTHKRAGTRAGTLSYPSSGHRFVKRQLAVSGAFNCDGGDWGGDYHIYKGGFWVFSIESGRGQGDRSAKP
ncbi:MAG: hypothetical protein AN484_23180 [Aphanizomenon flos-aquae WA102]|uniref:Uncharacterized protein n=1 Tax=Aphanizomenon flos-aquae WA102 TaxID=1710896 RepID=A0A1B7WR47_APHFL|nr:MAG: hypothetical protein AN484_23180 [Aphanizomenon flos-aquae WA102]